MCGIVGYVGSKPVVPLIINGLRKLEYRGYDSAGLAVVDHGKVSLRRTPGKLSNLIRSLEEQPLSGNYGIGHTRWATHGRPTEENAHPHRDCTGNIIVVHNGIIENYLELKTKLQQENHTFVTDTDTEVIAHLVESLLPGRSFQEAAAKALEQLRGQKPSSSFEAAMPFVFSAPPARTPSSQPVAVLPSFLESARMNFWWPPMCLHFSNIRATCISCRMERWRL